MMSNEFILALASNLAYDLLKAGSKYFLKYSFSNVEQRALQRIYEDAFVIMLTEVLSDANEDEQKHIGDLFREFVRESDIAIQLLDLALSKETPSLENLKSSFELAGFDTETIPFDDLIHALIKGLEDAAVSEARNANSPIINRLIVGRFDALYGQLDDLKALLSQPRQDSLAFVAKKPSVFISYARADAKEFAKRLHDDLHTHEIDVWLDQGDMASGNTFIDEITHAIKDADYFLLIFTPGAIKSQYCQDEWKRALEYYKPIIPILRIGTYNDLPKEANIYLHDAPDFTSDALYETSLEKLLFQLRKPPRPAGSIYGVPHLPRNYLHREQEIIPVREALTQYKTTVLSRVSKRVGIQGMGGIGKSVITNALARDYVIRRSFPDGIFWLHFGTEPDLRENWRRLREWLEGGSTYFNDKLEAVNFFEQATANRECLIILDDVWASEHVEAFMRLGEQTRVVVSSRDGRVLDEIDADSYNLSLLSDAESAQLLAQYAAIDNHQMPQAAKGILQLCGNLPLALAMIGAMVRGKSETYWEDAFNALKDADLEEISARFPDYSHYPNLFAAIEISIQALDSDLRNKYQDFAIFSEDSLIPEDVLVTFWKPLKGRQIRKMILELVERNLLQRASDNALTIHDLLLAYIRREIRDIGEKHNHLLDQYNPDDLPWDQIEDDGYLHDNLIYHLIHASRRQQVMDLFSSPHWLNAREVVEIPYYHKYLNDIQKAKEIYTTTDNNDIPARITLSFVELSVRRIFDGVPEELPEFLIAMENDVENVIIPLALMRLYRGEQVKYLEKIGESLLSMDDHKNAERVLLLAADILLGMSNSEIMSERTIANTLWDIRSWFVKTGCNLARFGRIDQRIFVRLQEISEIKSEYDEYAHILHEGAAAIAKALAEHGYLDLSLETLELALKNAPKEYRRPSLKSSHMSLKTSYLKEIAASLISGKHFDLAEKLLDKLDAEREDTQDLWGRYLQALNEGKEWARFRLDWDKIYERYPDVHKLKSAASSWRTGFTADHILSITPAEIPGELQNINELSENRKWLKYYRILYATRFDVHVSQGHFIEAEKDIDALQELNQIDDISGADKRARLKTWATIQDKIAFRLLELEDNSSSKRYSEKLILRPSDINVNFNVLPLSLAVQNHFNLLNKILNLDYRNIDSGDIVQATLKLEGMKEWQLLTDTFFEDISDYSKRIIKKICYSFMAFQEGINEKDPSAKHLDQIKQQEYEVFVSYVQGVALREGIETGLALIKESFRGDHQEWDRVRYGFSLAQPFILLRSPQEAEDALNLCFSLIWDKNPGYGLLTNLFWRLSTQLSADELAARMNQHIKKEHYDLKGVVGFAKDMLFIDEAYSRDLIIALLRLQVPKPHFGRYSSVLFREDNNSDVPELDSEIVWHYMKDELGIDVSTEAFNLLKRTEEFLSGLSLRMIVVNP